MGSIKLICISRIAGCEPVMVETAEAIPAHGLRGDRYCSNETQSSRQLTLIESENVDDFNRATGANLGYNLFRRNLVTEGVRLNNLVGHRLILGEVYLHCHALCEPCRSLQEKLKIPDLVKRLVHKGGVCCEILTRGKINVGDTLLPLLY